MGDGNGQFKRPAISETRQLASELSQSADKGEILSLSYVAIDARGDVVIGCNIGHNDLPLAIHGAEELLKNLKARAWTGWEDEGIDAHPNNPCG